MRNWTNVSSSLCFESNSRWWYHISYRYSCSLFSNALSSSKTIELFFFKLCKKKWKQIKGNGRCDDDIWNHIERRELIFPFIYDLYVTTNSQLLTTIVTLMFRKKNDDYKFFEGENRSYYRGKKIKLYNIWDEVEPWVSDNQSSQSIIHLFPRNQNCLHANLIKLFSLSLICYFDIDTMSVQATNLLHPSTISIHPSFNIMSSLWCSQYTNRIDMIFLISDWLKKNLDHALR